MLYQSIPQEFSYNNVYTDVHRTARSGTKEYYLRAGNMINLPPALRLFCFYLLLNDRVVYMPRVERITRSTDLRYYFRNLTTITNEQTDSMDYNLPLMYTNLQLAAFNLKDICTVRFIEVTGQIQDTFERVIPEWAREYQAQEQLAVSLTAKLSPKHRVRVYTRGPHILVFTTKGISDAFETDYRLQRITFGCLPILRNWIKPEEEVDCPDIIELCKKLDGVDAAPFWNLLELYFSNNPTLKDLKYSNIIQTFNNISVARQTLATRQVEEHTRAASSYLNSYADALEKKKAAERVLLELQQTDETIATDIIKMLVDKKICYDLDISRITNNDGIISYRCSAPLLSYDKDAARALYNRRVTKNYHKATQILFKLLFLDEKVVLNFDQAIDVKLNRSTFTAQVGGTFLYTDINHSFPNTHHYYYNCWGSYGSVITKLINEYKLEELFYQIKAAIGSLNFLDPPVADRFVTHLESIVDGEYNPRCFYWRDENCTVAHTYAETVEHFREETTE